STSSTLRAAGSRLKTLRISSRMRSNIVCSPLVGLAPRYLLGFGEDAAQDVHFQLGDAAAPVQPAQPCHEMARLLRIQEADLHQRLFQMAEIALQLLHGHRRGIHEERTNVV